MTREEIYAGLTEIFYDIFDDDTLVLRPDMTAGDVPEWDSHNHISIIVATEMRFGLKFQTAEIESLRNVGELAQCIERKLNGHAL
jgi:acyl carrier protein